MSITTDYNDMQINELVAISDALGIRYVIEDGRITSTEMEMPND